MATAEKSGFSRKNTLLGVFLLLFGGVWLFGTAIAWSNEFASGPAEAMGTARVVRIDSNPPYVTSRRPNIVISYPVFEYIDAQRVKRHLTGKGGLNGYFKLGDEVKIGRCADNVVVMDTWFRTQEYAWSALLALLATIAGWFIFRFSVTKPVDSA